MSTATLTAKGRITIPADVRRRMRLDAGDRVEFVESDDGKYVIKPAIDDVRTLEALLRNPARPISIDEMNAAIRKRRSRKPL